MSDHSELVAEIAMVEKMSTQERLKHAKKRRMQQLKKWGHYEKHLEKENNKRKKQGNNKKPKKKKVSKVHFTNNVMLLEAAARNDLEEVRNLLTQGVTPDVTNEDGLTALHQCCIDDSEEMMKLLIEFGANVNARDSELWTPLHAAATCGHNHLCKYLIDKGAELLAVNADGNMPYDICEDELTLDYIETEMAKRGVTQELIDETRLSTEKNMLEDLRFLAQNGGDLEFVDRNGATPLHTAAANGYLQVAEFLLDQHVSVDVQDDDSWMPIHAAACWGHPAILELLVHSGADIESKTKNGETPFDICEDLELKQRIIELKDEIETNKATRVVELRQRRNQNPRSSAICSSASSLYSSNTSLTDKNPFSASVRRTSMREKSAMSWKEAREEARLRGSTASDEGDDEWQTSTIQNGNNKENVPTSNIDDVKLAVTDLEQRKDSPVPEPEPRAELNDNYVDSQEHDIGKVEKADGSNSNISVANDKRTAPTPARISQPSEPAPITSPKQASNAHPVVPSRDKAIPSGTLADLKKQRALQLQNRLQSTLPNHNSNNVQDNAQNRDRNNTVSDNRNGHSKKLQNSGNNGSTHIPADPPLHRFTAAPASEIIGGNESKHRCCVVM